MKSRKVTWMNENASYRTIPIANAVIDAASATNRSPSSDGSSFATRASRRTERT